MAQVSTYLNFPGTAEAAFQHYKEIFGGEFTAFARMGDAPPMEGYPPLSDDQKKRVMHVCLPVFGHNLMASDVPTTAPDFIVGTNIYVSLHLDSEVQVNTLFAALSAGGKVEHAPALMFWGDYWGVCADKFGIQWMLTFAAPKS